MKVNHSNSLEGNARYEGFVVDLIKELAKSMDFDYTFYVQENADNGKCQKANNSDKCRCTGMMAKILSNVRDTQKIFFFLLMPYIDHE